MDEFEIQAGDVELKTMPDEMNTRMKLADGRSVASVLGVRIDVYDKAMERLFSIPIDQYTYILSGSSDSRYLLVRIGNAEKTGIVDLVRRTMVINRVDRGLSCGSHP